MRELRYVQFNPAFPYIYLPESDFNLVINKFNDKMKKNKLDIRCKDDECRIEKSCEEVRQLNQNFDIALWVFDVVRDQYGNPRNRQLKLDIPNDMMYISGAHFDDKKGDKSCYLPIFKHKQLGQKFN